MDNTDSEMIESLNILRPPVRRDYKTSRFGYQPNAVNFMSEWRKPKKRVKCCKRIRRSLESSTSLILKKTSDTRIFDGCPVVSYTNTSIQRQRAAPSQVKFDLKNKPLIKVIVVPNDQPSEGKQTERNKLTKIFLKSSEDDNAIETKNVYLVVAGRKKDKIYEIKTTESATLLPSGTELKDEAVTKVFNGDCFRQLIKALNMERKKTNLPAKEIVMDHVCKCSSTCKTQNFIKDGPVQEIDTGLSKVRIYGQLGLTEDDKYIIKCNATVDDKPVPTTFSTVGQKVSDDPPQQMQPHVLIETAVQTDTFLEHRITQFNNDNLPRRSQPRDTLPQTIRQSQGVDMALRRTQQIQRKLDEYPPANVMAPRKTQQTQRRMDEYPPGNDMALRKTQQTQRRMDEYPPGHDMGLRKTQQTLRRMDECLPGNDLALRKCQQTQRRMDECFPGNDMAPRKTQQTQRRMDECLPGNDMAPRKTQQSQRRMDEFLSGNDMAPRKTQQTQRRMDEYPPGNDMAHRITQQTQRRMDEYPPGNDMAPRITQLTHRRMDEYPPGNDMMPRKTQQTQRRTNEYPPGNDMMPRKTQHSQRRTDEYPPGYDMMPRKTQQTQRRMDEHPPGNDMMPRKTQLTQRQMDEYPPGNHMDPRKTRESQRKTFECPPGIPLDCRERREVVPGGIRESLRSRVTQEAGNLMGPRQTRQSQSPSRMILEERRNSLDSQATQTIKKIYQNEDYAENNNGNNNFVARPSSNDKNTQCTCNCVDPRLIKGTQSPLVIISVYPNQDVECKAATVSKNVEANFSESPAEAGVSERQRRSSTTQSYKPVPVATVLKDTIIQEDVCRGRTYIHKSYRIPSRSPTPQNNRCNNKKNKNKVIETRMVKTNRRSQSPTKILENKSSLRSNTARTIKKQESKKTPTTSKQKIIAANKCSRNTQISKTKCKSRSKDKCNGNQTKSKSLLADKYKKAINERVNKYNRMSPKHDVSTVSINIDSENECYDVSFHQGKYMTDLLVRNTSKYNEKRNDSTINFLPISRKSEFQDSFLDNSVLLDESTSKLNPRDSLEISHRHNLRTEIETQTKIELSHSVSKDDTRYFAPIKHFTGDDCTISDPFERDREIQQLLGVSRRVISSQTTDVQKNMFGNKNFITQQCFSDEWECKDILYSNVDFKDSLCSCCCVRRSCCRRIDRPSKCSLRKSIHNAAERHQVCKTPYICDDKEKPVKKKKEEKPKKPEKPKKQKKPKVEKVVEKKIVESKEVCKEPIVERTSLYQQLTLNRNIHIFLQVEQFSKEKPIILSKEQYDKVKKTIQSTLSKNKTYKSTLESTKYKSVTHRKDNKKGNKLDCECIESLISIGEVRQITKQKGHGNDETEMQTENKPTIKRSISRSLSQLSKKFQKKRKEEKVDTCILYSRDNIQNQELGDFNMGTRHTMSSLEVRYASIAYLKHVTFSSLDAFDPFFEPLPSDSSLALKDSISIETLFKGHKKSPTPNLGTSSLSCISEPNHSASLKLFEKPNLAKRPFLKRLMSCLVMRSDKTELPTLLPPKCAPTVDSSFDSYHFSTSLGAIEMTSSLYDTSASFFSNHSVYPKTYKLKRRFLNSMRGFLYHRRS